MQFNEIQTPKRLDFNKNLQKEFRLLVIKSLIYRDRDVTFSEEPTQFNHVRCVNRAHLLGRSFGWINSYLRRRDPYNENLPDISEDIVTEMNRVDEILNPTVETA